MDPSSPQFPTLEWIGTQAVFSPPIADAILSKVREGYSLRAACGSIPIPYRVASQWVDNHPTFGTLVEEALTRRCYELETRLLQTEDPVQAKTLMQALRRAAPEVWADPRESPPDTTVLPQMITLKLIEPERRSIPPPSEPKIIMPGSDSVN